jgi:hypothetical protein
VADLVVRTYVLDIVIPVYNEERDLPGCITVLVYHLDQRAMGFEGLVGGQVQPTGCLGMVMVNPGGAHGDQADATLGPRGEVVARPLRR